jgi:hypothetical protein
MTAMNSCGTKCCIHLLVLFTFCIYSHMDRKLHKSVMYDYIIFCLEEVCNTWKLSHLKSRICYKTLLVIYIAQRNVLHKTLNQLPIAPAPCAWFSWLITLSYTYWVSCELITYKNSTHNQHYQEHIFGIHIRKQGNKTMNFVRS